MHTMKYRDHLQANSQIKYTTFLSFQKAPHLFSGHEQHEARFIARISHKLPPSQFPSCCLTLRGRLPLSALPSAL